jgi:hypothetical protein
VKICLGVKTNVGHLFDLKNNYWLMVFEITNQNQGIVGFKYLKRIESNNY